MKKVYVKEDVCIGCGACIGIEPDVFDFNNDGYAYVKEDINTSSLDDNIKENIQDAADSCPVDAIEIEK